MQSVLPLAQHKEYDVTLCFGFGVVAAERVAQERRWPPNTSWATFLKYPEEDQRFR